MSRRLRSLADHDPADPVENAVLDRLAGNWSRRAAVKRPEIDLDDVFEPDRPDYPDALLPFRDHPVYLALDEETRARLRGWAWVSFNKNVMDIEQRVVNPGFALLADGTFGDGPDEAMTFAITQAMVDEQYHTLMHLNASAVMRRRRGWRMPESALPLGHKARAYERKVAEAGGFEEVALTALAFTTVAEVSINAFLDLIADDPGVQPINQVTATLHNRDEYCHAAITDEVVKAAYARFTPAQRHTFRGGLMDGMEAFGANDFTTWHRIVSLLGIPGGEQMVRDAEDAADRKRLLQDFSGLHRLCADLGILDQLDFDWSTVATVSTRAPGVPGGSGGPGGRG